MGDLVGAVLTGGASRRMGRDKATLVVEGTAMAGRVLHALRQAGIDEVAAIGPADRAPVGAAPVPDRHPGEGPLGGVLTALEWAAGRGVLVAPCDLIHPDPASLRLLADALADGTALAAVPSPEDPLPVALAPAAAPRLAAAFAGGERSLRGALAGLAALVVALPPNAVADADRPDELPGSSR